MNQAEDFFKALFEIAVSAGNKATLPAICELPRVANIFLFDASTISLNQALSDELPGVSKASCKIHLAFNLTSQTLSHTSMTEGKCSDQSTKTDHLNITEPGDLIIRDLGYFEVSDLQRLNEENRFYLSRLPLRMRVFHDEEENRLNLWQWVSSQRSFSFDRSLKLGTEKLISRVVGIRLPKWKWKARLEERKQEKGRALSKEEKAQAKWNLYVTNLDKTQASIEVIQSLYELRWQIEIFFKALKSGLKLGPVRRASCKRVVSAYIWSRLTLAAILLIVRGHVQKSHEGEIRVLKWFNRLSGHLSTIGSYIQAKKWLALAKFIHQKLAAYCIPEKSRRKSSQEKFNESSTLSLKGRRDFKA